MVAVAGRNSVPEMPILCLDDLVRVVTVMCEVTRSTQLPARHRLHLRRLPGRIERDTARRNGPASANDRTEASVAKASSILLAHRDLVVAGSGGNRDEERVGCVIAGPQDTSVARLLG
jgi:hypothetical protein